MFGYALEHKGVVVAGKDYVYPEVGEALRKARENAGLSQDQLAENSGISRITISRIEQAHINPSFRSLEALAQGMGRKLTISFDEIVQ